MKKKRQTTKSLTMEDYIKAAKRGNREAEQELLGPGFHSKTRIHKSKKLYTRKHKHKGQDL